MQSPTSLTCRPLRYFGAADFDNRTRRIIGVLRITAKRRVRKGDSPGTGPCRLGPCPPERPTLGPAVNGGPPLRPGPKALPCRRQQSRDRPPLGDRTHLGAPHSEREDSTMSNSFTEFYKIWIEQCAATEEIRERFGLESALDYLIGEKIFSFVMAAERDPDFAAELPVFIAEIRRLFTAQEIHTYLDELERTKFLAPGELDGEHDPDDEAEEEPWQPIRWSVHRNCCGIPVCGSFSRIEAARRTSS